MNEGENMGEESMKKSDEQLRHERRAEVDPIVIDRALVTFRERVAILDGLLRDKAAGELDTENADANPFVEASTEIDYLTKTLNDAIARLDPDR